jgi:hypothetical protein
MCPFMVSLDRYEVRNRAGADQINLNFFIKI